MKIRAIGSLPGLLVLQFYQLGTFGTFKYQINSSIYP